ncbi:hypothetical protein QFC21_003759 [Naganishia friedmannii]|uniref:Uncharacterized protein n=1 Tax=Naganishia friedmannii TaxID=89922 RepID=A0ACC2VMB6_9TREE|nr:hypothetical protein QFC21_003759 [Naganishia friedmannii]
MSARMLATALLSAAAVMGQNQVGVTATFPNGVTNPPAPTLAAVGSVVNQTSYSRLLTLNGVDDFCIFGPPEPGPDSLIGNVEPIVVAYCAKARNGARIIPDGTIHSAHFIKTPMYVQIQGYWDGTRAANIPYGDYGGELDPHGAENLGNPIGGNVTSNVSGQDVFYEEWMSFVSFDQYCLRICTANSEDVNTALQCEHELDVMGCQWVMPGDYTNGTFDSCLGEAAAPPGSYPDVTSSQGQLATATSTFRQRYTGTWSAGSTGGVFTVGQTVTPAAPAYTPATSSCTYYATVSNGINTADYRVVQQGALVAVSSGAVNTASTSASTSVSSSSAASSSGASSSRASSGASAATSAASSVRSGAVSGASAAASSATSASSGFRSIPSVDAGVFAIVGAVFAGVVGGMAVLL